MANDYQNEAQAVEKMLQSLRDDSRPLAISDILAAKRAIQALEALQPKPKPKPSNLGHLWARVITGGFLVALTAASLGLATLAVKWLVSLW